MSFKLSNWGLAPSHILCETKSWEAQETRYETITSTQILFISSNMDEHVEQQLSTEQLETPIV